MRRTVIVGVIATALLAVPAASASALAQRHGLPARPEPASSATSFQQDGHEPALLAALARSIPRGFVAEVDRGFDLSPLSSSATGVRLRPVWVRIPGAHGGPRSLDQAADQLQGAVVGVFETTRIPRLSPAARTAGAGIFRSSAMRNYLSLRVREIAQQSGSISPFFKEDQVDLGLLFHIFPLSGMSQPEGGGAAIGSLILTAFNLGELVSCSVRVECGSITVVADSAVNVAVLKRSGILLQDELASRGLCSERATVTFSDFQKYFTSSGTMKCGQVQSSINETAWIEQLAGGQVGTSLGVANLDCFQAMVCSASATETYYVARDVLSCWLGYGTGTARPGATTELAAPGGTNCFHRAV